MFDSINFKGCDVLYSETTECNKEDLLQLRCKNGRLIDVGWYGSDAKFCIYVIENENWETPCYKIENQPKLEYIEHHLQKVIDFETAEFNEPVQNILNQITYNIDNWTDSNEIVFDDFVELLVKLRDMGLTQKEVGNYIEISAMKYNGIDDVRWDLACDILDRITGFCAPEFHIWRSK